MIKTRLDLICCEINDTKKNIALAKKNTGRLPDQLVFKIQELDNKRKEISCTELLLRKNIKKTQKLIGNLLDDSYFFCFTEETTFQSIKNIFKIDTSNKLIQKQRLLMSCLSLLETNLFEILQVPFSIKPKFFKKFLEKSLRLNNKKKNYLISNPIQQLLPYFYKERLLTSKKLAGFGVCFNENCETQEKVSLLSISPLSESQFIMESFLLIGVNFYKSLNFNPEVVKRPANKLKLSCAIQYDYYVTYNQSLVKIFSCSNHTDYLSSDLKIKMSDMSNPGIITANFCNLNKLVNILAG